MHQGVPPSAFGLIVTAMMLVALGDTAGKLLTQELGVAPGFGAWSRFALGAAMMLPLLRGAGLDMRLMLDWRIWLRGGIMATGILCVLTALKTEGMATVFGAFFVGPLLSYALGALLLKEPITRAQTLALFAGFAGVLIVVRPGFGMTAGTGFGLLAGLLYGCFLTTSRWLRDRARPRAMLMAQLLVGSALLAPVGLTALPTPTPAIAALTLGSATGSMLGNLCLIFAYRRAPASRLAPFIYTQLVMATALGFFVFGDWPDALTLIGLAVLIGAGLVSFTLGRGGPATAPVPAAASRTDRPSAD